MPHFFSLFILKRWPHETWEKSLFFKRRGEIFQIKMFNPDLSKNKSYYMNFNDKNTSIQYVPL